MHNGAGSGSRCVLLVSNSRDFATDFLVAELRIRGVRYLRLDTDLLCEDSVSLDPITATLDSRTPQGEIHLEADELGGVLFRAPTHLSESGSHRYSPEVQLCRHQWAAFTRALTVFEDATWINHPVPTYAAESKPYQLRVAARLGWDVLPTLVTNAAADSRWLAGDQELAIKALDTFFTRIGDEDAFFYTRSARRADLTSASLRTMPVILQRYLPNKLDLRVTVVGDHCLAASILHNGAAITGDWRLQKDGVDYEPYELPREVATRCIATVRSLGLVFGAIDLLLSDGRYFFLEVNPTGEWAWLTQRLRFPIPRLLADALCNASRPLRTVH